MKMYKSILAIFTVISISSCIAAPPRQAHVSQAALQPTEQSALTPGMAKKHIKIGTTSQTDVMSMFGPPNMITSTADGGEMWGYDRISTETIQSTMVTADGATGSINAWGGAGFIGAIGRGVGGIIGGLGGSKTSAYGSASKQGRETQTTKTIFLLVYFDKDGKVTNTKLSATKF